MQFPEHYIANHEAVLGDFRVRISRWAWSKTLPSQSEDEVDGKLEAAGGFAWCFLTCNYVPKILDLPEYPSCKFYCPIDKTR